MIVEKSWHIPPTEKGDERSVLALLHQCLDRAVDCCRTISTVADHKTAFSKLQRDLEAVEMCMREMGKLRDDLRWLLPIPHIAEAGRRSQRWLVPFTVTGKKLFELLAGVLDGLHVQVRRLEMIRPPKLGFVDLPDLAFTRTQGRPAQVMLPPVRKPRLVTRKPGKLILPSHIAIDQAS